MSDMKTLTLRDLNRKTASVLDALERGETFELRRNGKAVGYFTQTAPPPGRKPSRKPTCLRVGWWSAADQHAYRH
jgi:antitoxin (DNA-binding transcriptional repressor) of toxin-antitoxin stability system